MQVGDFEFEVLVNGIPVREYEHNGHVFIEARKGTEYALRVRNHSNDRVEAVISVDGLSIMDGKPGNINTSGYVYGAHANPSAIPGWRVDDDMTARFKFGAKGKGYAKAVTGDDNNRGIIACAFFREKYEPPVVTKEIHHHHDHYIDRYPRPWRWPYPWQEFYWDTPYIGGGTFRATGGGGTSSSSASAPNVPEGSQQLIGQPLSGQLLHNGGVRRGKSLGSVKARSMKAKSDKPAMVGLAAVEQRSLATEFGSAADFHVGSTSFTRASKHADVAIQFLYRTREELQALGVDLRGKPKVAQAPTAFPANSDGCPLPAGWAEENLS